MTYVHMSKLIFCYTFSLIYFIVYKTLFIEKII
jgi:hypothetical protein